MLPYVRMIVNLLEGVELSGDDVFRLLRRTMRQHSINVRSRIDYILGFVNAHPP